MLDDNLWLLSGMAVGIATLMIAWWIVSEQRPGGARLHGPDRPESGQNEAAGSRAIEKLEEQLTGLNERMKMLTDSITYLESKLIRAHVITDSIIRAEQKLTSSSSPEHPVISEAAKVVEKLPPPAAGQMGDDADAADAPRQASAEFTAAHQETSVIAAVATTEKVSARQPDKVLPEAPAPAVPDTDAVAGKPSNTGKPMRTTASTATIMERQNPVAKEQPPASVGKEGAWVINLASSPSQADADGFAARARSRGIETQQQQVTVKGKHYWRVQITGFSTADEAQAYAGTIREKLGLKDAWITTR